LLVDYYSPERVYAKLRQARIAVASLPPTSAAAWKVLIERHLDAAGNRKPTSDPGDARADLAEVLGATYDATDAYFETLITLHNKSLWMILSGVLLIAAVIAFNPDAIPVLGMGAIGGLLSRFLRVSTGSAVPNDYGAFWVPVLLAPIVGALAAWAGILILQLGKDVGIFGFETVDLSQTYTYAVAGLAVLLGFTEGFFQGIAKVVTSRVQAGVSGSGSASGTTGAAEGAFEGGGPDTGNGGSSKGGEGSEPDSGSADAGRSEDGKDGEETGTADEPDEPDEPDETDRTDKTADADESGGSDDETVASEKPSGDKAAGGSTGKPASTAKPDEGPDPFG
jgi:hypothetical protein